MKLIRYIFFCLGFFYFSALSALDSLRVEQKNGQYFVVHQIDQGETIYALSKRYGSPINSIMKANDLSGGNIDIGQIIWVPIKKAGNLKVKATSESNTRFHKVAPGESLWSISQKYNVSINEIKQWNQLTTNAIDIGQNLVLSAPESAHSDNAKEVIQKAKEDPVAKTNATSNGRHRVQAGETLFSIAKKYDVTIKELRDWNGLNSDYLRPGENLIVSGKSVPNKEAMANKNKSQESTTTTVVDGMVRDTTKIYEEGFAMVIENSPETKKYLALHKEAPIGTVMEVKNQMNNKTLFVRVVGKLPNTGVNKNLLIRISKIAHDRLGALDPKIPIELAYYPY